MEHDISVSGPGSPVSLKKVLNSPDIELKELNLFVTNDTFIVKDDPSWLYITAEACQEQALYFLNTIFDGIRVPHYAFHHILYLFGDPNTDRGATYKRYPDSQAVKLSVISGKITADSEEYKLVLNRFKYGKEDLEFLQILGMIQLISGSLRQNAQRIYIEHPETHLHPKRQAAFMVMLDNIRKEYEFKPGADVVYDSETASLRLKTKDDGQQEEQEEKMG